ncbi:MAG: autotransporter-associated beta strand repeat-containing protein, partial [Verrucomicrobiota bacterium]
MKAKSNPLLRLSALALFGFGATFSQTVQAATITWDGGVGGTGTTLDTAANWVGDTLPITSSEALLDNSVVTLPSALTLSSAVTYGDLLINSPTLTSISLTGATSQTITLSRGTGGTAAVGLGGAASDILVLGTNVTGTVSIGGGSGAGSLNLALGASGNFDVLGSSATLNVSSVISNTTAGYNLAKTGPGALTLSGTNTFTGGVTLTAGTLNLNAAAALGTGTFVINGGTLDNTSGVAVTTGNNVQTWNIDYAFTGTNNLNLGTGAVSLGSTAGTRTVTVNAGNLTVGGVISSGTATSLTKAGAGALTLSANSSGGFAGGVTLNAGTLNINNNNALGTTAGTFVINGGSIDNTSGAAISASAYKMTWNSDINFIGASDGTHNLSLGTGAVTLGTTAGTSRTLTVTSGTLAVGGVISIGSTANSLVKAGSGALSLSGVNTFTGGVTLSAGTLNINNAAALGAVATSTFTINGGTIANTSGTAITTGNYLQTWGGGFSFGSEGMFYEGNLNLGTGAVTLAGSSATLAVTTNGRLGTLTVGGVISDGTTAKGITKNGTGTLFLTAANAMTGGITLNAGILNISNAASLGTGQLTINGGYLTAYDLTLTTNNTQAWNESFTIIGSVKNNQSSNIIFGNGAITLGKTVTVTNGANNLTESGAIGQSVAGSGISWVTGLYQGLSASTTLTGASTYSGATVIQSRNGLGTTTMSTGTITSTSSVTVNNGGIFVVGASGVGVVNRINANASLTLGGDGGAIFKLMGSQNATVNQQSFTGLTVGTGANTLYTDQTSNTSIVTITGATPYTRSVGGVLRIAGLSGAFTNAPSGAGNVFGSTAATAMLLGATWQNGTTYSDANNFVKVAAGTLTALTSTSNSWGTGVNTDVTANSVATGAVSQSLRFGSAGSLTLPGAFTVESGGVLAIGSLVAPVTITGGTLKTGIAGSDLWIVQGGSSNVSAGMVIGSQIIDNSGSSLTKVGPRALYLTNTNNTYAGGTYLGEGILNIASGASLGTGALNFTGLATLQTAGATALGNRSITISTGGIATFDTNGYNVSADGVISGAVGNLTKTGVGTLTLTGANTYAGATSVQNGTLLLDFSGANAPVSDLINANSLLILGAPVQLAWQGQNAGCVTLAIQGKAGTANSQSFNGVSPNLVFAATTFGQGVTHLNLAAGTGGTLAVNLGSMTEGTTSTGQPNTLLDIAMGTGVTVTTSNVLAANGAICAVLNSTSAQSNIPWITVNGNTFATLSGNAIVGKIDSAYSTDLTINSNYLDVRASGALTFAGGSNTAIRFNDTNNTGTAITLTKSNGISGTIGGILVTANVGAHTSTLTGGYLNGTWSRDLALIQNNTLGDLVVATQILDTNTALALDKFGAGRAVLTGTNIYSGNTYVNEGTLVATGDYMAASNKAMTTTNASTTVTMTDTSGLFVGQRVTGTGIYAPGNGSPTIITAITPNSSITVSVASTASGTVTGTFKSGGALGGFNTAAANTYITTSGTLQIGDGGTTGSLDPNNLISNLGALVLSRSNANTFGNTISGTVVTTSLAGTANINTLEIKGGGTTTLGAAGTINGSGAGGSGLKVYTLATAGNVYAGQVVTGINISAGTVVSSVDGVSVTLSKDILTGGATNVSFSTTNTFAGNTTITGGSTLTLGSALALQNSTLLYNTGGTFSFAGFTAATLGGLGGAKDLALTNASSVAVALTLGGNNFDTTYSGNLTGSGGSLIKNGIGTLTLSGTNAYTGGTTVNAGGTLQLGSGGASGSLASAGAIANNGNFAINRNNAVVQGTDFSSTAITGTGTFTQAGTGTTTLNVSNSYSGATTISAGTLALSGSGALSSSTAVSNSATFDISAITGASTTVGSITGNGTFTLGAKGLSVGGDNSSTSVGGGIQGSGGSLTKTGSGTLSLAGTNTYSGATTISAGTLQFAQVASLYNSTTTSWTAANLSVASGATLALNVGGSSEFTTGYVTTLLTYLGGLGAAVTNNGLRSGSMIAFNTTNASGGTFTVSNIIANSTGTGGGAIGVTKLGINTLVLSSTNSYSGKTAVQNGTLSFSTGNASATASQQLGANATLDLGVAATSSGTLLYTGAAGTLAKAVNALGNGSDTIQNSGSGLLTLSGTLTKNGTILNLKGGTNGINVTGTIAGTSANSDLYVNGGTVTLSAANSYTGPTFVNTGATLALGINNAIPSNSAVTLGDATTAGTLSMGAYTNSLGSLAFGAGGGTLKLAANQTSAAQLAATGTVAVGSGNTLDLTGMSTSAGLYKLVSGSSLSGTFGTVTGLNSNYSLLYSGSELDAQHKATVALA